MPLFLLFFIAVPLIEIFVLVQVGEEIGALNTVILVVATAMLGLALLRRQGVKALQDAQRKMAEGTLPAKELVEGVFLAVGGALLLTPGFVTDALGFCCLIPGLRHFFVAGLIKRLRVVQTPARGPQSKSGRTIEGQFDRED